MAPLTAHVVLRLRVGALSSCLCNTVLLSQLLLLLLDLSAYHDAPEAFFEVQAGSSLEADALGSGGLH